MYPFFETIRYINGTAENLHFHQDRVNNTLLQSGANKPVALQQVIDACEHKPTCVDIVYKCRVKYDLTGRYDIGFELYTIKQIKSLSIVDIGNQSYTYKYSNRDWLNQLLKATGTDEVLLMQNGLVKDATYANLAFYNGLKWITPKEPLLYGTRRAQLIQNGIITEEIVTVEGLHRFTLVKPVNAMLTWEEAPILNLNLIDFK